MRSLKQKEILKALVSYEMFYSQQSIYPDTAGTASPDLFIKGKYFSKEVLNSQVHLSNYENSYKMGLISGTSEFISKPQNMISLLQYEYKENMEDAIFLPNPGNMKINLKEVLSNSNHPYFLKHGGMRNGNITHPLP